MRERVISIVAEQSGRLAPSITDETTFFDDLSMDELDMMELIMYVEEEFQMEITEDDQSGFLKVKDLVEFVEKNTEEEEA